MQQNSRTPPPSPPEGRPTFLIPLQSAQFKGTMSGNSRPRYHSKYQVIRTQLWANCTTGRLTWRCLQKGHCPNTSRSTRLWLWGEIFFTLPESRIHFLIPPSTGSGQSWLSHLLEPRGRARLIWVSSPLCELMLTTQAQIKASTPLHPIIVYLSQSKMIFFVL